jgi:hypothetical protein
MEQKDKIRSGLILIGISVMLIISVLAIYLYNLKVVVDTSTPSQQLVTDKSIQIPDTNKTCTNSIYNESSNSLSCNIDDIKGD